MPDAQPAQAEQQEEGGVRKWMGIAQNALLIWGVIQFGSKFFTTTPQQQAAVPNNPNTPAGHVDQVTDPWSLPPTALVPYWPTGIAVDMHVALSTSLAAKYEPRDKDLPKFVWRNITYGDWDESRVADLQVNFPLAVLNNGTLWADIFLTRNGAEPNPHSPKYKAEDVHHIRKVLTPHLAKARTRKEKNLLSNANEGPEEEEEPEVIVPHWHPNVTLALISDSGSLPTANLAAPVAEHLRVVPGKRDDTGSKAYYMPIIFPNEFWHLRQHYMPINETTPTLPLQITFQPMSFMKFQIFASMTHGFKEAAKQQGQGSSAELDEIKRMLLETNPWFLGLTGLVSILHVVFEMLAFKNDVTHWKDKKEMVGVSLRTIITNVVVQTIILLYLIDNNENTSWMILFGSGMGVLIEAWKITKAVDIRLIPSPAGSLLPYKLDIKDKHVLSEDEKKTQEYDKLAFRYVSYAAIPLLVGYTVYSLVYESHRGWYSFVISTLTSFVYMFGFVQLVPQLIINYKLKSVAHMPMKAMIYKTLSTVVDDLFAFCIKMPFLHRLACFRDDVVFLVFLYQRWIYRIDPKRVNEYGQVLGSDVDKAEPESRKDR